MSNVMFVPTEQILSGVWLVRCLRCNCEIGTMSGESVMRAVHHSKDKGGVMCPECRQSSCNICGKELYGFLGIYRCYECEGELLDEIANDYLSSSSNLNTDVSEDLCRRCGDVVISGHG